MSNEFTKQITVAWDEICEGFEDGLKMLMKASVKSTADTEMERGNDTMWRKMPYIMPSFDGRDQTANFTAKTQLSVPASIGFEKSSPWTMTATELRDGLQDKSLFKGAKQKILSDVNLAILNTVSTQATQVVKVTTAAGVYDDIAECDSLFNEQGIPEGDRYLCLNSRDYNGFAGDLAEKSRSFGNAKSDNAYEKGNVGMVAGFNTDKLDYSKRVTAAAGSSLTISTLAGASNYYTPEATSTSANGEVSNVDNRYQTVTISSTTGVAAGDAFTIAGVDAVHMITKESTGQLKTFRVIKVVTSTTMIISPPIISNQGGTGSEEQYQNCEVTPSGTAAIVFLNVAASGINPFWYKDSLEFLPGNYVVKSDAGVALSYTSEYGARLLMQYQYDLKTMETFFRVDTRFGVCLKNPEMAGILIFNQT